MKILSADTLDLYDIPGRGAAASEIYSAAFRAVDAAAGVIGDSYCHGSEVAVMNAFSEHVAPAISKYEVFGAMDGESYRSICREVATCVSRKYSLSKDAANNLYNLLSR